MLKRGKVLFLLSLIFILLTGCNAAPPTSGEKGGAKDEKLSWNNKKDLKGEEITLLWVNTDGENGPRGKILKEFTKDTGIKVKEIAVDYNSLYNKITTAVLSNSADIDLAEMDTIWAGQFMEGKIAYDLADSVPKDVQKKYTQSSLSSVIYKDQLAAVPFFSSTKHFYWNKELLAKAGYNAPPKTWDEFREMSKKLTKNGVYGSAWSWKQAEGLNCDFVSLVYGFGGKFFDENGTPVFNKSGGLKALQFMVDLVQKDKTVDPASMQWSEDDVKNAFAAGKIAMMTNWEGMYPDLNDPSKSKVMNKTDVGLMPGNGDVESAAVTGSEGISLMRDSKHKQAALQFLKWMSTKQFQLPMFEQDGMYPTLEGLYDDPDLKAADKTKTVDKIMKQYQYGQNRPNAPGYVEWADILSAEIHEALLGKKSPEDALNTAAKNIEKAIEDAK